MRFNRYELKYYLSNVHVAGLIERLANVMDLDVNCDGLDGYKVRSLYFDSIDDECLYQKQSGLLTRSKIRLRTYGDPMAGSAKLEIKKKHDQFVHKDSVIIDRAIAKEMQNGNFSVLLKLNNGVANRVYAKFVTKLYRPKVIVEYQRLAFVLPISNIRITFDMNLHSNINHTELFSDVSNMMPVIMEGKQIMEVKFEQFVPMYIKKLLSSVAGERAAISKYTLARRFNKVNKWEDN